MKHIFVVDDEKTIRDIISKYLIKEGYKVTLFENGTNVLSEFNRLNPDLLVIDIMMPGPDGLELCKQIRKSSEIPIIFVSARDEELDRILGLELGADDYLTKPFSPRELIVRIKNIFRRLDRRNVIDIEEKISIKDLNIYNNRRYIEKGGIELELTTKEYDFFTFLIVNKNIPFTRNNLLEKVWGYDYEGGDRLIDDLVKRIRKKLKDINSEIEIKTVWGTAIKLKTKLNIGGKLFATYFFLLLITFFISTLSFQLLTQKYLINETREQLRKEGALLVNLLTDIPLNKINTALLNKRQIAIANRYIDAEIIILNTDKKVMYSSTKIKNFDELIKRSKRLNINREYVVVSLPLNNNNGLKGYVMLLTKLNNVKEFNNLMLERQILSFSIAGIIALIIGFIFEKSITKPLKFLTNNIKNFSIKNTANKLNIKTGDEIEALADSFNQMADRLRNYDNTQKQFLQNVSHELKTPLMGIQGNAEAIKEGIVEGEEVNESLDIIIEESQRLKRVVDEIIYLSKLENYDDAFIFTKANVKNILDKAIKSVLSLATKESINIHINGNLDYIINADSEKLTRAFINVLSNGIRYAKSEILITGNLNEENLEILFADDGIGFKDGENEKVFDRFYKGENGGTGIGLAITQAVIIGHSGRIYAYKNNPTGAIFKIILPL